MNQLKIQKKNLHLQFSNDIPFPSTHRKENQKPKLGGVSNLKFFCKIDINKMAAIFQFFHNGQHWYSISVNTRKTGDPNFGESVIWNFSTQSILMKCQPFFNFFIRADADIPFLLTLRKPETQTLGGSVIWNFFVRSILTKSQPFFNFLIMADADIFRFHWHSENWRHQHQISFPTFSVGSVFPSPFLGSVSTLICGYA